MCARRVSQNGLFDGAEIRITRFASLSFCPLTIELDRELLSIVDNVLHPTYRELDRPQPTEPEIEYQSRLDRVKSVCQKWNDNGWYRANILPQGNLRRSFDYKHALNRITCSNAEQCRA